MLESISGNTSIYGRQSAPAPTSVSLSDSQRSSVQNILAEYDAENLSEEDAQAINAAFRAEGIRPSAELKSAVEAAGFDAAELKPQDGPQGSGRPPPPPPPSDEETVISTLFELLEEYEGETLDENAISEIQAKLQEAGFTQRDSYISLSV